MAREEFTSIARRLNKLERRFLKWLARHDVTHLEGAAGGLTRAVARPTRHPRPAFTYLVGGLTAEFAPLWSQLNITPKGQRVAAALIVLERGEKADAALEAAE